MSLISGQSSPSDPFDLMKMLEDEANDIEIEEANSKDFSTDLTNNKISELFVVHKDDLGSDDIHAKSLSVHLKERDIQNLTGSKEKNSVLEGFIVLHHHKNKKNESVLATHEDFVDDFRNKNIFLHRSDRNDHEQVEQLSNRNIVYIGLNNVQYEKIVFVANRIISSIGDEYEKNKKREEELKNSLKGRGGHIAHVKHLKVPVNNVNNVASESIKRDAIATAVRVKLNAQRVNQEEKVKQENAKVKDERAQERKTEGIKQDELKRTVRNEDKKKQDERLTQAKTELGLNPAKRRKRET